MILDEENLKAAYILLKCHFKLSCQCFRVKFDILLFLFLALYTSPVSEVYEIKFSFPWHDYSVRIRSYSKDTVDASLQHNMQHMPLTFQIGKWALKPKKCNGTSLQQKNKNPSARNPFKC